MFFTDQIDYNTRYARGAALAAGFALIGFYFVDRFKSKVIIHPSRRDIYVRILTLVAIAIIAGSIMSINNSIADAKKIEFLGPYKAQQIGVNRYLGQLDQITVVTHQVKLNSISPNDIPNYVSENKEMLDKIRVWNWDAAYAKLRPEIGLIPYVNFENNDILRFNDTLYWSASMKPILPDSVSLADRWYTQHLVYTHVDNGFLALNAHNGTIVDSSTLFKQRVIYYGEGGLFSDTWAAYPVNRQVSSDIKNVPWSVSNPYLRLVGYALIDTYDGNITLIKTGDDFFTNMFSSQYGDRFVEMPSWLAKQLRYPQELFDWKVDMFDIYHVTDPSTFINSQNFYEVPPDLATYYVEAKPPGFDKPTFIGLLSLELRGSQGKNLAGFMTVQNDLPNLGKMQFHEVPLDSKTKLLGPSSVSEALNKDSDFRQLKTLLQTPSFGDNILYRIGDQDVYFIPVYTAGSVVVVTQLGTITAVGAAFDGEYFVGMGNTPQQAFASYLAKLSGVAPSNVTSFMQLDKTARIDTIQKILKEDNLTVVSPTSIQLPLSFQEGTVSFLQQSDLDNTKKLISTFVKNFVQPNNSRIIFWQENNTVKLGAIMVVNNVPELHYISIGVG